MRSSTGTLQWRLTKWQCLFELILVLSASTTEGLHQLLVVTGRWCLWTQLLSCAEVSVGCCQQDKGPLPESPQHPAGFTLPNLFSFLGAEGRTEGAFVYFLLPPCKSKEKNNEGFLFFLSHLKNSFVWLKYITGASYRQQKGGKKG